jgi:hypothetical protein
MASCTAHLLPGGTLARKTLVTSVATPESGVQERTIILLTEYSFEAIFIHDVGR